MQGEVDDLSSDAALLAATAAGERPAFERFAARHRRPLARFLAQLGADAEDVAQEALIAAHRAAGTFRGAGTARAWLFQIARRLALRRRPRQDVVSDSPLTELAVRAGWGEPPADPETAASEAEARAQVRAAFARLSPEDREVLHLRDVEGLTGPEAALALDLHIDALKTRLHRARLRLMASLVGAEGGSHAR